MRVKAFSFKPEEREIMGRYISCEFEEKPMEECRDEELEIACVFINSKVDGATLSNYPNLKAIITASTGYDHIDLKACKERGIRVFNVPCYGTNTVAEFSLMLILASLRRLKEIMKEMESSLIIDHEKLIGRELSGKTVGIIGTGRIGSRLIELLQPFNVEILAFSRTEKKELVEKYGVKYVELKELLSRSDVISLHLPLTPQTKHIINEGNISLLKPNAVIVNTARGALVENKALLKRADVLYLGLDVVEGEKLAMREIDVVEKHFPLHEYMEAFIANALLKHPHVILTPHIAYNTHEAMERRIRKVALTVKALKEGGEVDNEVRG